MGAESSRPLQPTDEYQADFEWTGAATAENSEDKKRARRDSNTGPSA
jgi:hypothetical protein